MSQAFKTQFLAFLLALLVNQPRFRLVVGLVGLTIGLAIDGAELIGKEVAVGFSGCFLWKELINFFGCWTANNGSQVCFSSGYPFYATK